MTFHVKFDFISKFCLFVSLLRHWNISETCKNGVCWTVPHHTWCRTHSDMHADRSCHGPWNSPVTYQCETSGVLPALDSAIWQWILQTAVGFHQIIRTSHTDILYYNIGNHRNNCKTAFIGLYLFGSHTLRSALILARLSTHGSPSLFHILTSFVRTSLITLFTNRPCHGPWSGLGDCAL